MSYVTLFHYNKGFDDLQEKCERITKKFHTSVLIPPPSRAASALISSAAASPPPPAAAARPKLSCDGLLPWGIGPALPFGQIPLILPDNVLSLVIGRHTPDPPPEPVTDRKHPAAQDESRCGVLLFCLDRISRGTGALPGACARCGRDTGR